jgi:hypothetical protein
MNWKPGDRAIFMCRPSKDEPGISGSAVTLIELFPGRHQTVSGRSIRDPWHVATDDGLFYVAEKCLYPLDDPNQKLETWNECPFKPETVK